MKNVEVKECPFCKSKSYRIKSKIAKSKNGEPYTRRYVVCNVCKARGPISSNYGMDGYTDEQYEDTAIKVWNDRSGWI